MAICRNSAQTMISLYQRMICIGEWFLGQKKLMMGVKWILSPTLAIADCLKESAGKNEQKTVVVKSWNISCLIGSIVVAILLGFFSVSQLRQNGWIGFIPLMLVSWYALSRCNEIFYAFVRDATSHLMRPKEKNATTLKYYERIQLALRSYLELVIDYAILFFSLSIVLYSFREEARLDCIKCLTGEPTDKLQTMVDALYFSGVTIFTLGYGDITPHDSISRFLALHEIANGIVLIVVSFTVYVARSIQDNESASKQSD